jgi:hypothetical protein
VSVVLTGWPNRLTAGTVGGLLGGTLMAAFSMSVSMLQGPGMWMPVKLIGGVVLGSRAVNRPGSFDVRPILMGLAVHAVVSVILGILFALLSSRLPPVTLILYGVVYALVIWLVALFLVLPVVDPLLVNNTNPALFALSHMMYGLSLGWWIGEHG